MTDDNDYQNSLCMYNIHKFVLLPEYIIKFKIFIKVNPDLKNNKYLFVLFAAYSGDLEYVIKARRQRINKIESRKEKYIQKKISSVYVRDKLVNFDCHICDVATKGGQLHI